MQSKTNKGPFRLSRTFYSHTNLFIVRTLFETREDQRCSYKLNFCLWTPFALLCAWIMNRNVTLNLPPRCRGVSEESGAPYWQRSDLKPPCAILPLLRYLFHCLCHNPKAVVSTHEFVRSHMNSLTLWSHCCDFCYGFLMPYKLCTNLSSWQKSWQCEWPLSLDSVLYCTEITWVILARITSQIERLNLYHLIITLQILPCCLPVCVPVELALLQQIRPYGSWWTQSLATDPLHYSGIKKSTVCKLANNYMESKILPG